MRTDLSGAEFRGILLAAADAIIRTEPRLNALDAALGDGDHGITMRLGFDAVRQRLAQLAPDAAIDAQLTESAQAFLGATGGAIGIILARMLMGGAAALHGCAEMGTAQFGAMLAGMESATAKAGKAKPGDKTILDAIHAAVLAVHPDQSLRAAMEAAAAASEAAAESTAGMICRVGRASRLGERALGHPDPGAVSFSIMLRAMAQRMS